MAIAFIQYDDFSDTGPPGTTIANDSSLNTTAGNLLVVVIGGLSITSGNAIVTGVTDTAGNTYTKAIGVYRGSATTDRNEIWYAENIITNASNITTATYTGKTAARYISVSEYSGVVASSSLLDISSQANVATTSHSSGVATSSNTGDLIVGGYIDVSILADITVGSDFTTLSSDLTAVYWLAEYDILGAAGDYDADCTTSVATDSIMVCAIFAVAGGTNYTSTLTDSISFVDSSSKYSLFNRTNTDNQIFTDVLSQFVEYKRIPSDTQAITDITSSQIKYSRVYSDNQLLYDSTLISKGFGRSISDNQTFVDNLNKYSIFDRSVLDNQTFVDSLYKQSTFERGISDNQLLSDLLSKTSTYKRVLTDNPLISDNLDLTRDVQVALLETYVIADSLSKNSSFNKTLSEGFNISDLLAQHFATVFLDSISFSDSLTDILVDATVFISKLMTLTNVNTDKLFKMNKNNFILKQYANNFIFKYPKKSYIFKTSNKLILKGG